MKQVFILAVAFLMGCATELKPLPEDQAPEFPAGSGQEPRNALCKYHDIIDQGFGECRIIACTPEGQPEIQFKPNGWWCLRDHPDAPTAGTCDGWGICLE